MSTAAHLRSRTPAHSPAQHCFCFCLALSPASRPPLQPCVHHPCCLLVETVCSSLRMESRARLSCARGRTLRFAASPRSCVTLIASDWLVYEAPCEGKLSQVQLHEISLGYARIHEASLNSTMCPGLYGAGKGPSLGSARRPVGHLG